MTLLTAILFAFCYNEIVIILFAFLVLFYLIESGLNLQ